MIGFKFKSISKYEFYFSQYNVKHQSSNDQSQVNRGSSCFYFPNGNHDPQTFVGNSYDLVRGEFEKWLDAIIYFEGKRKEVDNLFNPKSNQQPENVKTPLNSKLEIEISEKISKDISKLIQPMFKYHSNYTFLKDLILKQELHLSKPEDFNDKLDSKCDFKDLECAKNFIMSNLTESANVTNKELDEVIKLNPDNIETSYQII